jgi:tetratricopeptide (TPR) repeat protein
MPEKSLNDISRDLRLLFTKGNDALQRDNYDYAIDLYNQVLAREPGLYECRKALRAAQAGKTAGGTGFFKKVLNSAGSSPMVAKAQLALRKDPLEALNLAEHVLNSDPESSSAHKIVIEAASALQMPQTAVLSLEVLARISPKDLDIAIKFANSLADAGQEARAEKILGDLSRANPTDIELAQAHKNLAARKTLSTKGYQAVATGKGTYRDILKDKEEAVILEQQNRQVQPEDAAQRLIQDYEKRLESDPNNLKVVRNLAELYAQKNDFDRSLSYYAKVKASESSGSDASLDKAIADTMMRKLDHQISQLDPSAPDYSQHAAKLQAEKQAYQLAECQKRAERFPTDLAIRFELGQLYFKAGKLGEAIKEFQKAQMNPHRKIASMNYLAQCFSRRGIHDLAVTTLQDAIKEKLIWDDEKKELVYNLGAVFEKMGKREDACAQFKQIWAVDAEYRDVDQKMNDYHPSQGG